jgi:hypothetical protein
MVLVHSTRQFSIELLFEGKEADSMDHVNCALICIRFGSAVPVGSVSSHHGVPPFRWTRLRALESADQRRTESPADTHNSLTVLLMQHANSVEMNAARKRKATDCTKLSASISS